MLVRACRCEQTAEREGGMKRKWDKSGKEEGERRIKKIQRTCARVFVHEFTCVRVCVCSGPGTGTRLRVVVVGERVRLEGREEKWESMMTLFNGLMSNFMSWCKNGFGRKRQHMRHLLHATLIFILPLFRCKPSGTSHFPIISLKKNTFCRRRLHRYVIIVTVSTAAGTIQYKLFLSFFFSFFSEITKLVTRIVNTCLLHFSF